MDRVTRYRIFSIAHSPRPAGLDPDGDTSYTFEVVDVGPEASGWGQDKPHMWPTNREALLNAARTWAPYSPHAFPGPSSPWTLWGEGDEDEEVKAYPLDNRDAQPQRPRDLEQERWEVIQGQALRKSGTVATLHGTPGHLDPRSPGPPQPGPLEESMVDREQIDFLAARQQFLSLEQANAGGPVHPPALVAPAPAPAGVRQAPRASRGLPPGSVCAVPLKPPKGEVLPQEKRVGGLMAASGVWAADAPASPAPVGSPELPKETPIEREIRLAQEREAELREQRGLRRASSQQELVAIPTRPLLTRVSLSAAPRRDRGRPSLYVQRDLVQGTQREEDHRRREGLQATQRSPAPQSGLRRAVSSDPILDPAPEVRKVSRIPAEAYQPFLRPGSPGRGFPAALQAHGKPPGLWADEGEASGSARATGSPKHLLEPSGNLPGTQPACPRPPQGLPQAHRGVIRWEYFHLSPLRFRVPERVPDVALREEGLHSRGGEAGGMLAPRLRRSPSSELLEREVEGVLRREREVAQERQGARFPEAVSPPPADSNGQSARFPEVFSPPPADSDGQDSRSSSAASGVTGRYSVSGSHFFSPVRLHSGLVWTADAPADTASEQRRRKEQRYAGISSSDHVDMEVLEATRVTRHKNAMARRWEAGIYTGESQD